MDNDGYDDLIIVKDGSYFNEGKIHLLSYCGNRIYDTSFITDSFFMMGDVSFHMPVLVADFNGDQKKDVAVDIYLFKNLGSRLFAKNRLIDSAGAVKCSFDADKDGGVTDNGHKVPYYKNVIYSKWSN